MKGIGPAISRRFHEVGVDSVADLLLHVPRRYLDRSQLFDLAGVPIGEEVTVGGTVEKVDSRRLRGNRTMTEAVVSDGTSRMRVVWFNPYLKLEEGAEVALSGKVELFRGHLQMKSPDVERLDRPGESLVTGRVVPVYPALGGLTPVKVRRAVDNALRRARPIEEVLPTDMIERGDLVGRDSAFVGVHFPDELAQVGPARRRLVFDELFRLEVALAMRKRRLVDDEPGVAHVVDGALVRRFEAALPYRAHRGAAAGDRRDHGRSRIPAPDAPAVAGGSGLRKDRGRLRRPAHRGAGGVPGRGDGADRGAWRRSTTWEWST